MLGGVVVPKDVSCNFPRGEEILNPFPPDADIARRCKCGRFAISVEVGSYLGPLAARDGRVGPNVRGQWML